MEFLIEIRDLEEVVHEKFRSSPLNNEDTLDKLKEDILWRRDIPKINQELFFENGEKVTGSDGENLQSLGFVDGCKVIVKHSLLPTWLKLLKNETIFDETNDRELKKEIFEESKKMLKLFLDSNFYCTYYDYNTQCLAIHSKFYHFLDEKFHATKNSCDIYFKKKLGNNTEITFGYHKIHSGDFCCTVDGQTFHVKTHRGVGPYESPNSLPRYTLDPREHFVYKLLENLKIGAETHFIDFGDRPGFYLASREISELQFFDVMECDGLKIGEEYAEITTQILCVFSVLMLGHRYAGNMGVDGAANFYIVNFSVKGRPMCHADELHMHLAMRTDFNLILGDFEERLKISVDFLEKSNFLAILETCAGDFLQNHKALFENDDGKVKDFEKYIENVKRNVQKLYEV